MIIDIENERLFFTSRGKVVKPRKQKLVEVVPEIEAPKKKRKTKRGNAYQNTRTGLRQDLNGIVARSAWEANCMRALGLYKIDFQFEPKQFEFPPTANGRRHIYIPDIYLPKTDEYIEVKGYLDSRGRNKLRKFKKHYPDDFKKLIVVISKSNKANKIFFTKLGVANILYYENIKELTADKIALWEGKK
jgi:hypothetical protein